MFNAILIDESKGILHMKGRQMKEISLRAYAKINLVLDVLGKREDGYHELRSVMQTVGLYDTLAMRLTDEEGIRLVTDSDAIPAGADNIIVKAIDRFCAETGMKPGVEVRLEKNIPVAAGMGGGSSDAAAAIKGMNSLTGTGLDMDGLIRIGAKVGADVPFCLMGGTALAEGIGEKLTPLKPAPGLPVIIIKPPFSVSRKQVYEGLQLEDVSHPYVDAMISAIERGDAGPVIRGLGNVLETVTTTLHPEIDEIKKALTDVGADSVLMSGSGPTVFGLYTDASAANEAYKKLIQTRRDDAVFLTRLGETE